MPHPNELAGVSRRSVLKVAAGIVAGVGAGGVALDHFVDGGSGQAATRRFPFLGEHQAGVAAVPPPAGVLTAFDVTARNRNELTALLQRLTAAIRSLMTPDGAAATVDGDGLRVTVSVGASLFDVRFGLEARQPRQLTTMHRFPNDHLDPRRTHGDLLLAVGADRLDVVAAATRALAEATAGAAVPRWTEHGFVAPDRDPVPGGAPGRNLLGFKDGTANPDLHDPAALDRLVWVQPGDDEPEWAVGGTYQVVRTIRMAVGRWDQVAVGDQERIIGRSKASGAPIGQARETEVPDYARDPSGARIPLGSHIRRANPRTADSMDHQILRQALSYSRGFDEAGQLDEGLLFVCYQRDLDAGFVTVQTRLNGEELERFVQPVGGGYFFALPGVPSDERFLGDALVA